MSRRLRRRSALALLFLAALAVALPSAGNAGGAPTQITLLFDTHLHGNLTGANDVNLAHYLGLVAERRAATPNALFLGSGDDLGGSAVSGVFKGAQMVEAFNAAGLVANTIGNHDLDYGPDNFIEQVRASRFTWVSANVTDRRTGDVFGAEAGVRRYVIVNAGPVRVGITGMAWPFLESTSAGPNVVVEDAVPALNRLVPQMRAAGAQVVIVMSHMSGPDTEAVAARVNGVNAYLGDHNAERIAEPKLINGAVVARRGDEFDALGELTLTVVDDQVVNHNYRDHEITSSLPRHAGVQAIIDDYTARLEASNSEVIGASAVSLDAQRSTNRSGETNLGSFIADTLRAWGEADIAIMNGGGVRGDREFPAGPLTRGDVLTILPFNNTAVLLRLSGDDIRAALENGLSRLPGDGRFPQVSGITYSFDADAEPGSRLVSVQVDGTPLVPDRMYTLATLDFLAGGGDGYTVFSTAEVLRAPQAGPLLSDLIIAAVREAGTISPEADGRITQVP